MIKRVVLMLALSVAPALAWDEGDVLAQLSGGGQVTKSNDGYVVRDLRGNLIRWVRTDEGYEARVQGRMVRVVREGDRFEVKREDAADETRRWSPRKVRQVQHARD